MTLCSCLRKLGSSCLLDSFVVMVVVVRPARQDLDPSSMWTEGLNTNERSQQKVVIVMVVVVMCVCVCVCVCVCTCVYV